MALLRCHHGGKELCRPSDHALLRAIAIKLQTAKAAPWLLHSLGRDPLRRCDAPLEVLLLQIDARFWCDDPEIHLAETRDLHKSRRIRGRSGVHHAGLRRVEVVSLEELVVADTHVDIDRHGGNYV